MPKPREDPTRLLVISPVRNEAKHIALVARAVAAQTRPPDLWLVVDDGSDDGTLERLHELAQEIPFMRVLQTPEATADGAPDRLAAAAPPRVFNWALGTVSRHAYTHIAKLDGDIELSPEHYEFLLGEFVANPALGIAGCRLVELTGDRSWKPLVAPEHHVHGAVKLYSRECFEAVDGIVERLGWDTIDETYARMAGYRTQSYTSVIARHHRPWGSADGRLRGRARHGEAAYILHYSVLWVALRSLKVARAQPVALSGIAFLWGFLRSALRHVPRVDDREFRRFTRMELRTRLRGGRVAHVRGAAARHPV